MIAIKDVTIATKYFAAVDTLAVLDTTLKEATTEIAAVICDFERDRPFLEGMATAEILRTAAHESMKQAVARLLDADSVETFFMLAQQSCMRALATIEEVMLRRADAKRGAEYRDRFRSVWHNA